MHILLALATAVAVIAGFIIRASYVARAGRDLGETAAEMGGFIRRSRWRRKTKVDLAQNVTDPRLAATAMMCAMAKSEGDITEQQKRVIRDQMRQHFQLDGQAADEMFAQARWLTGEPADLTSYLTRLHKPVLAHCDERERRDLIDMLSAVAHVEGEPTEIEAAAIERLSPRLGLSSR